MAQSDPLPPYRPQERGISTNEYVRALGKIVKPAGAKYLEQVAAIHQRDLRDVLIEIASNAADGCADCSWMLDNAEFEMTWRMPREAGVEADQLLEMTAIWIEELIVELVSATSRSSWWPFEPRTDN